MSDPDLNYHFRRRWTEPAQTQDSQDQPERSRKRSTLLDDAAEAIRDEWRRGRFERNGSVR
jgi:hypothetical protein